MSQAPIQSYVVFDASTVAGFKAWSANFISANLATMGWTKTADAGQVTWANVTTTLHIPQKAISSSVVGYNFRGAWVAPTTTSNAYVGNTASNNANDYVTYTDGITYQCVNNTQLNTGGNNFGTVTRQTAQTLSITSISQSGSTMTVNFSGGTGGSNAFQWWAFTISGCANAGNNGTFIATASAAGTLTITNFGGVTETPGAATAVSSANSTSYQVGATITSFGAGTSAATLNTLAGLNITIVQAANGSNNITAAPCVASFAGTTSVLVITNATGATSTVQNAIALMVSPPTALLYNQQTQTQGFFQPYHYEIWQTNDSTYTPIFLKVIYGADNTSATNWRPCLSVSIGYTANGNGLIVGANKFAANSNGFAQTETSDFQITVTSGTSSVTNSYECTMCGLGTAATGAWLSLIMWRNNSTAAAYVGIERDLDQNGIAVDNFINVVVGGQSVGPAGALSWAQQAVSKTGAGTVAQGISHLYTIYLSATFNLSMGYNGAVPVLPVFPMHGFVSNPSLIAVTVAPNDVLDGQIITCPLYGTTHNYLVIKNIYSSSAQGLAGINSVNAAAVRFETAN